MMISKGVVRVRIGERVVRVMISEESRGERRTKVFYCLHILCIYATATACVQAI